jgi:crotonobetaine/carnitine-CoA ligase
METVFEAFAATTDRSPEAPFFCVPAAAGRDYLPGGGEFSYREFFDAALDLAQRYRAAGYGHGHRAALLMENRPEFFQHFLALNVLGVSIVPVNPDYRHDEMLYLLDHSEAEIVVSISSRVGDLESVAAEREKPLPVVDAASLPQTLPPPTRPAPLATQPGRATECALLYTSGTTGRPKGCMLSNHYFLNAGEFYLDVGGVGTLEPGVERILNPLPLFHMNALAVTATGVMLSGCCLISPDRFHPKSWWQDVIATRATAIHYLGVVPPMLLNLPPVPEDSAHQVKVGFGAGVDPEHHRAFEERFGFPLMELWGMTETGRVFADMAEPRAIGTRAFGRPMKGFEARVVDDDDNDVATGQDGELLVRFHGPDPRDGFFSGYLKNEDATEEAWQGGWFHTGDVVRQDASGMLFFVDRKKNIIRRSGENIAAAEIEAVLQADEAVAQAAVIAVPDALREEEVMACIVAMPGQAADEALANRLFDWCHGQLAYFKAPGYVLFRESLPTTGTQKVQKTELFAADEDPTALEGCFDLRERKRKGKG